MTSRKTLTATLLLSGLVIFIFADYAGLFGLSEKSEFALHEIKLRITDNEDGAPLVHTRAKCFKRTSPEACTQRVSGKVGIVSIMVPATKLKYRSLLFNKGEKLLASEDADLQVMLIHTDYMTQAITININDDFEQPGKVYHVAMQSRGTKVEEPAG